MEIHATDWIIAIGAISTPVVVALLGLWWSKQNQAAERRAALERELQADRIEVYQGIMKPFMIMFMNDTVWASEQARNKAYKHKTKEKVIQDLMWSEDWLSNSFRLTLIGSDAAVRAFNGLMDTAREQEGASPSNPEVLIRLLATLLLEIRRSAGNDQTSLEKWDMLRPFIINLNASLSAGNPVVD